MEKIRKIVKIRSTLFCNFYKNEISGISFISTSKKIFFALYQYLSISHRKNKKKSRNKNFCKKQVRIVRQLKMFLREMNNLLVVTRTPSRLIYKMMHSIHLNLSNSKKHATTIILITYQKNQSKYKDFPKCFFCKIQPILQFKMVQRIPLGTLSFT